MQSNSISNGEMVSEINTIATWPIEEQIDSTKLDPTYFNLLDIAQWANTNFVSLPTVQRGFVWRPYQIEELWDSLLRNYPIGAFVMSRREEDGYEILDGQQRATAICLGFAQTTFRDTQDHIRVFIDLDKPDTEDHRKYIFRVITRSHPWGYQRTQPSDTLTSVNIRKAIDRYGNADTVKVNLDDFYPHDAHCPLPFNFFLEAAAKGDALEDLMGQLTSWKHYDAVITHWQNHHLEVDKDAKTQLYVRIARIYADVLKMLCRKTGQKVPAMYMSLGQFNDEDNVEQTSDADEIENLFVRLNSGGTQLVGEELNYSILKAHLSRNTQDIIEKACKSLARPARFITIAYRLYQSTTKGQSQTDALSMRIKPKQFQRTISKQAAAFGQFLETICLKKAYNGKTLLEYTEEILRHTQSQTYGLPFLVYSKLSDAAPELVFMLLYRIYKQSDRFPTTTIAERTLHRKALGMLTMFLWFGKGENHKDHARLLTNIWPAVSSSSKEVFWSGDTVQRASINGVLIAMPNYEDNGQRIGLSKLLTYTLQPTSKILNRFEKDGGTAFSNFLWRAIHNRDLILYAQRGFLEEYFQQDQYRLEDTNMPFDWDHISPNKFVYSRRYIPQIVKDWYGTIGNFRAWPYALNRMDSDNSPAHKLAPFNTRFHSAQTIVSNQAKWLPFVTRNQHLVAHTDALNEKLAQWSFCDTDWYNCNSEDMVNGWPKTIKAILHRNVKLIKEWYDQLFIEELLTPTIGFDKILNQKFFSTKPTNIPEIDKWFNPDHRVNWMSKAFKIGNHTLWFYFHYPHGNMGFLQAGQMNFGMLNIEDETFIGKMKAKLDGEMDTETFQWVEKSFTLLSCSKPSVEAWLNDLKKWLNKLSLATEIKEQLVLKLMEGIDRKLRWRTAVFNSSTL